MATLSKIANGFLFEDTFNEHNLLWQLSPNDGSRVVYEGDYMGLKHGDLKLSVSIPTPQKNSYIMQAHIYHHSSTISDVSGIVILSNSGNQIEYQNYFNEEETSSVYQYVKVCAESDVYTFYASVDGVTWILVGNSHMYDANRIGFFIDGVQEDISDFLRVKDVEFYKSNILTIGNTPAGATASILNTDGQDVIVGKNCVSNSNGKTFIDLTTVVLPVRNATIVLKDETGAELSRMTSVDIYGGDIFEHEYNVVFSIADKEVTNSNVFDLGNVSGLETIIPMTVTNKEINVLTGIVMTISAVSYYKGGDNVTIAANGSDFYSKSITLPDLEPNEPFGLNIKINRDFSEYNTVATDSYRFKIILQ
jgi:hypothetical protein